VGMAYFQSSESRWPLNFEVWWCWVSSPFPRGGSEYGGVPGLIQPPPHDIKDSAYEQASLAVRSEPWPITDPRSSIEGELAAERKEWETRE
jgi:hypothetical protein